MTIRKQILKAMRAALLTEPVLHGRVYRSRTAALVRNELPAIVIRPADETVTNQGDLAERDFYVELIVIARGEAVDGDPDAEVTSDDAVDDVIAVAHPALCVDPSFGGLSAALFESDSRWLHGDNGNGICELQTRYRVRLYTPENSLTGLS